MNVVLWVVAAVLALAFLGAGLLKLTQPTQRLAQRGLGWVEQFPTWQVKGLGVLEILAAIGLILPAALDIAPILVPLAATGLAVVMIGAAIVHARRNEKQAIPITVVLFVLAAFLAWRRFGPDRF